MKRFFLTVLLIAGFIVSYEYGRNSIDQNLFAHGSLNITSDEFDVLAELLDHLTFVDLDDGFSNDVRTVRFTGLNVQIVNGLGATNGYPTNPDDFTNSVVNSTGNLIVGYNEEHPTESVDRTGSHNLVTGYYHNYLGYGNNMTGRLNTASGATSLLSGMTNEVDTLHGAAIGGRDGVVSNFRGVIIGGRDLTVTGENSVAIGGQNNTSSGGKSVVVGGFNNEASGSGATVTGGEDNVASGNQSSVSGGNTRTASGEDDWRAGSLFEGN